MTETIEFRIPEDLAQQHLPAHCGTRVSIARKVVLPLDDPLVPEIGSIDDERRHTEGRPFFTWWHIRRSYTPAELRSAATFRLVFRRVFEPAGEQCGTKYDETSACPRCGAGARQVTPLFLDARSLQTRLDWMRSIAGELIVSQRVADLFRAEDVRGVSLVPVQACGRSSTGWYQLQVVAPPLDIDPSTRVGQHPFDFEPERDRCPRGDTLALNLISELRLRPSSLDTFDVTRTRQFFGVRRGVLRPEPQILVSPRLWALVERNRLKGARVEVAHLTDFHM